MYTCDDAAHYCMLRLCVRTNHICPGGFEAVRGGWVSSFIQHLESIYAIIIAIIIIARTLRSGGIIIIRANMCLLLISYNAFHHRKSGTGSPHISYMCVNMCADCSILCEYY